MLIGQEVYFSYQHGNKTTWGIGIVQEIRSKEVVLKYATTTITLPKENIKE